MLISFNVIWKLNLNVNYIHVAWEPSTAKVTKSYSRSRRLLALKRFLQETKFSLLKSTHSKPI